MCKTKFDIYQDSGMKKRLIILSCLFAAAGCSNQSVIKDTDPHILIETDYGNIEAVLYAGNAPITVTNFLRYIKQDRLSDARFYRVVRLNPDNQPDNEVKIEVLQGRPDPSVPKETEHRDLS
jgi:hypothetical protein